MLASFAPDWVSPPGETILDIAEERGWTLADLARRLCLDWTEEYVRQLVSGEVPLDADVALRLARELGGTVEFWLAREASYRKRVAEGCGA